MSTPKDPRAVREAEIHQAFAEAADELELELEVPASSAEEPRMVGALAPAAHVTVNVDESSMPEPCEDDQKAIQDLIETWERAEVDGLADVAEKITTNPFVIIKPDVKNDGDGTVGTEPTPQPAVVDHVYFKGWVQTDKFRELVDAFPTKSPRKIEVNDVQINFIGPLLASVLYNTREEGSEGKVYLANAAAIAVKHGKGWKLTQFAKHARHE